MSKSKPRKARTEKLLDSEYDITELSGNVTATKKVKNPKTLTKSTAAKPSAPAKPITTEDHKSAIREIIGVKPCFKFKTKAQEDCFKVLDENTISFVGGLAGTGKSWNATVYALLQLWKSDNKITKIYVTKPNVELMGYSLGYLPATKEAKMAPYIASLQAIATQIIGKEATEKLIEAGYIEVQPLAYIRGNTANNCVWIFDEGQNASKLAMKTVLTRLGEDSKLIITGDSYQCDMFKDYRESGMYDATCKLQGIEGIGFYDFTNLEDIVRNPLISKILARYYDEEAPANGVPGPAATVGGWRAARECL